MGDVCNVVEHDGTCNYQESGWWYFCCFSAILCDKGLKPAPKYSSRMEQNNIYIWKPIVFSTKVIFHIHIYVNLLEVWP